MLRTLNSINLSGLRSDNTSTPATDWLAAQSNAARPPDIVVVRGMIALARPLALHFYQLAAVRSHDDFKFVGELSQIFLPPQIANGLFAGKVQVSPSRENGGRLLAQVEQSHRF